MANNLTTPDALKAKLGNYHNASKFEVIFGKIPSLPNLAISDVNNKILINEASLPSVSITPIEAFIQGRKTKLAGDIVYPDSYTISFYNTEDMSLRKSLLDWVDAIDNYRENTHILDATPYSTDIIVNVLSKKDGTVTHSIKLNNAFIQDVAEIQLSAQNSTNTVTTATFAFTDFEKLV